MWNKIICVIITAVVFVLLGTSAPVVYQAILDEKVTGSVIEVTAENSFYNIATVGYSVGYEVFNAHKVMVEPVGVGKSVVVYYNPTDRCDIISQYYVYLCLVGVLISVVWLFIMLLCFTGLRKAFNINRLMGGS